MIKAVFTTEKNKVVIDISGHAGSDEKGKDLVCASASILMYTFLQDVSDAYKGNKLKKKPTVDIDFDNGGKAYIEAQCKKDYYAELLHTLFIIQKGFMLLEHNHKDYVSVTRLDAEKSAEDK